MRLTTYFTILMLIVVSTTSVSANKIPDTSVKPRNKTTSFIKGQRHQHAPQFAKVSGRVVTPEGNGIRNTMIILVSSSGIKVALSGSFGYFTINDVPLGESYSLNIAHPRFIFAYPAEIIKIHTDITDMLVVGELKSFSARK